MPNDHTQAAERAHLTDPEYRRLARAYGQSFDAVAHAAVDIVRERLGQVADIPTTPTRDAASAACAACDGSCGTCPYARPSGKPIPPAAPGVMPVAGECLDCFAGDGTCGPCPAKPEPSDNPTPPEGSRS